MSIINPFDLAAVAAIATSGVYHGQTNQLIESAATNIPSANDYAVVSPYSGTSIDSTVQFIQANYDTLFKRLAE